MPTGMTVLGMAATDESQYVPFQVYARLNYDESDPLTIRIRFSVIERELRDGGEYTEWQIGRELLDSGMERSYVKDPAGVGDVKCGVAASMVNYQILLESGFGRAEILLPLDEMELFLLNTIHLVPLNFEIPDQVIEDELQAMIEGGGYQ